MKKLTSISELKGLLPSRIISVYGAIDPDTGEATRSLVLTESDDVVRHMTGLSYDALAEEEGIDVIADSHLVSAFDLLTRRIVNIDMGSMPGIVKAIARVAKPGVSIFSGIIPKEDQNENLGSGFDFLKTATKACYVRTGEVVNVARDPQRGGQFNYTVVVAMDGCSAVSHVNAFGYSDNGEQVVAPITDEGDFVPADERYVARRGQLIAAPGGAPIFVSDEARKDIDGTLKAGAVALTAYTIHEREQGLLDIVVDLEQGDAA